MKFILLIIAMIVFCYAVWRVIGKDLANHLANQAEQDVKDISEDDTIEMISEPKSERQVELEEKIAELKIKADELRFSTDELKVTKMLEEVMKQLEEKENELEQLDTKIWLEK